MMIRSKRFEDFVSESIKIRNEEEKEQFIWEIWLHRIHDKSFDEVWSIVNGETSDPEQPTMSEESKKAVVMEAKGIYERFCLS